MRALFSLFALSLASIATCDEPYTFERTSENGLWSFVNSEQIADSQAETKHAYQTGSLYVPPNKPVSKDDNFRVVVGSGQNHSNHYAYYSSHKPTTIVPMIASTYFQHTSSACELSFRHRVHGVAGAELVVTTQHLEHRALLREDEENEDDAADWVRPTLRAQFKPISDGDEQWTKSRVSIGQTLYPTRIRIECHAAPTQRDPATQNVECNVDDITLINCDEELWKADTCSGKQAKKYLCHKHGPQKCIDYADVCDMTAECEGGEDEDNAMQKCMNVPEGARCDFEFPSETGCPQWKFFVPKAQSSSNSSLQYLQRTSHENKRLPSHGIPPRSYAYHGQNKTAGHFLFFSTYGQSPDQQPSGEVLYTYATTPSFPPTPSSVAMPDSPNYRACMVRFFFCHSGTATFQLMLEAGADWSHKEVLWTPPHAEGSDPCVWQKAAASIPHQDGEYRLKLAFGKLYKQPVSVAIDDFTMTPNCFHESNELRTHFAPDRLDVKSKTLGKSDSALASYNDDRKLWFVPHTGAYRVELFGAAGGRLPAQKANNRGGVVVMNVHLRKGQSLAFVSGTAGVSPCAEEKRAVQIKSAPSLDRLWRVICDANATAEDVEAARREAQNLFGSGGGGAAAIYVDDQLTAVAGGGGGVFPDAFALPDGQNATENAAAGGALHTDFDSLTNSTSDHSLLSTENWSAGSGASLSPLIVANPAEFDSQRCPNCSQMFGRPAISAVRDFVGGSCPRGRFWNVAGGQGGGGASCGPRGGGGAGFLGGAAGHKRNARGGRSAVLTAHAVFASAAGVHSGDGRVLFLRCAKECPENATCEFEPPVVGQPAVEFCLCPNGKHAREYTV
ncbi:Tyrosine-protein kinase receptor [Aphelenchoides fujianensis]|nr:Tyrosine-protein kinase receptor [Aphelenchoides fujianensis]